MKVLGVGLVTLVTVVGSVEDLRAGDDTPTVRLAAPANPKKAARAIAAETRKKNVAALQQARDCLRDQQRTFKDDGKCEATELRTQIRGQVVPVLRQEAKESIEAAKSQALEQSRKMVEEAKDGMCTIRARLEF